MRTILGFFLGMFMMAAAMAARTPNDDLYRAETLREVVAAIDAGATDIDGAYYKRVVGGWNNPDNRQIIDYLIESGAIIKRSNFGDIDRVYADMLMSVCDGKKAPAAKQAYFTDPEIKYDVGRGVRFMLDMMAFTEQQQRAANKVVCVLNVALQNGGDESVLSYTYDRAVAYNNVLVMEITRVVLDEFKKWSDADKTYAFQLMAPCDGREIPENKQKFDQKYDVGQAVRFMLNMMAFYERRSEDRIKCLLNVASQNGARESELTYAYDRAVEYNNAPVTKITRAILDELEQIKSKQ